MILVGCSNKVTNEVSDTKGTVKTAASKDKSPSEKSGYVFKINGVSIAMHAKAAPIIEKLGGQKDYFEAESCAFPGLEKTYTYNGFDLYTYEKDGVDYVASVVFTDDTVATTEGVSLFAKKEDMLQKYGKGYTQKEKNSFTYKIDKSELVFLIENDEVTSIEYQATLK
jgi:hypothetical protein